MMEKNDGEKHEYDPDCLLCRVSPDGHDEPKETHEQYQKVFKFLAEKYTKEKIGDSDDEFDKGFHAQNCYNRIIELWLLDEYGIDAKKIMPHK